MTNRLFIALDVSEDVQDEIIRMRDEIYGASEKVRWEAKNKLHLTLKFLGDVKVSKTNEITESLKNISSTHSDFKLSLSRFGLFYRNENPSILWVGLNDSDELLSLVNKIENKFEQIGFQKEKRRFKSHITLLRLKGYEDLNKINKFKDYKIDSNSFMANKITLMKSELTPKGSIYTPIESFKMN